MTPSATSAQNRDERSLLVELTRELLRTPAFKQLIKAHLADDRDTAAADAEALFWEDVELTMALASRAFRTANSLARTLAALARQARKMPAPLLDELFGQLQSEIDAQLWAEAYGEWRSTWKQLARTRPALQTRLLDLSSHALRAGLTWTGGLLERDPGLARAFLDLAIGAARSALREQLASAHLPFLSRR